MQGCGTSILLDKTATTDSEKTAIPNNNSIRGFDVIDKIKSEVDKCCGRSIVSCADIVAVAARDSVVALGGPTWEVPLGRRDSTTASRTTANNDIPPPFLDLPALINNFKKQGLDEKDLVALSSGHTLGFAQLENLAPLDPTPALFDSKYFSKLVSKKGLLHSDQALFNGVQTDNLVKKYSTNLGSFSKDFAESMIKMGNIKPLTGNQGQIRVNCRKVNV
ncbi:hypothetical protein KY289_022076 [Solanum tuberosum]|nr:hypothetical protein KY289_022076 [Solanum tuberosum]